MPNPLPEIRGLLIRRFDPSQRATSRSPLEACLMAILSPRTSAENAERALSDLKSACGEITVERLSSLDAGSLAETIAPAGHAVAKATRVRRFLDFLSGEGGIEALAGLRTESLRERLAESAVLSSEMTDTILLTAFHRPVFPVSATAYRVLARHRLIEENAHYESIREFFENRFESADPAAFQDLRDSLARVGKDFCTPTRPRCEGCPLKDVNGGPSIVRN